MNAAFRIGRSLFDSVRKEEMISAGSLGFSENIRAVTLFSAILKLKPATAKGTYLKGVSMASTMSPGITIDTKSFVH